MKIKQTLLLPLLILFGIRLLCFAEKNTNPSSHETTEPEGSWKRKKYNVLFIAVDDLNDYVDVDRYPGLMTPNLDKFRKRGISFTNAVCPAAKCNPSRAAIMSGLYPCTTGIQENFQSWTSSELLNNTESLAETFKKNGYYTALAGKVYGSSPDRETMNRIFDDKKYEKGGFGPHPNEKAGDMSKDKKLKWCAFDKDSQFPDVRNSNHIAKVIEKQDGSKPFFIALGIYRPHTPFTAPKRFFDMYKNVDIPFPPMGYKENDLADLGAMAKNLISAGSPIEYMRSHQEAWKEYVKAYLACITFADWSIGNALNALWKNERVRDNTIVFLWSDHGYHLGEKNHLQKKAVWMKTVRSPFVVRLPGDVNKNTVTDTPVELLSMYATLVDLCGLTPPRHKLEASSILPLLMDPTKKAEQPVLSMYYNPRTKNGGHTVFDGRYQYIRYMDNSEEFYDIKQDPYEWNNLISKKSSYMEIINNLKKRLPTSCKLQP